MHCNLVERKHRNYPGNPLVKKEMLEMSRKSDFQKGIAGGYNKNLSVAENACLSSANH